MTHRDQSEPDLFNMESEDWDYHDQGRPLRELLKQLIRRLFHKN